MLAPAVMLVASAPLHAQSYYGTLKGAVKDSSGAAVPNAEVSMVDQATKFTRKTVTNGAGEYTFNAVDPGTFTITVSATGLQTYERTGVVVAT